jgi:hypothetical protein
MADDCSRLFSLSDTELLTLFNTSYLQKESWRLVQPRKEILSSAISALRSQQAEPASFLQEPPPKTKSLEDLGKFLRRSPLRPLALQHR